MSDISKISIELLKLRENYGDFLSDQTFITANNLVSKLYSTAKANRLWWYPPKINAERRGFGGIFLEWNKDKRSYLLFVVDDEIYYARQDKVAIENGDINIENDLTEFWEWIAE